MAYAMYGWDSWPSDGAKFSQSMMKTMNSNMPVNKTGKEMYFSTLSSNIFFIGIFL